MQIPVLINAKTRKRHPIFCNIILKDKNRKISSEIILIFEAPVLLIQTTSGKLRIRYFLRMLTIKATRADTQKIIEIFSFY